MTESLIALTDDSDTRNKFRIVEEFLSLSLCSFKLLYNLEALHAFIVDVSSPVYSLNEPFCKKFLKCGGAAALWELLHKHEDNLVVCYRILQILISLLCGPPRVKNKCSPEEKPNSVSEDSDQQRYVEEVIMTESTGPLKEYIASLTDSQWIDAITAVMRCGSRSAAHKLDSSKDRKVDFKLEFAPESVTDSSLEQRIGIEALKLMYSCIAVDTNRLTQWYKIDGLPAYLLELLLGCKHEAVRAATANVMLNVVALKRKVKKAFLAY